MVGRRSDPRCVSTMIGRAASRRSPALRTNDRVRPATSRAPRATRRRPRARRTHGPRHENASTRTWRASRRGSIGRPSCLSGARRGGVKGRSFVLGEGAIRLQILLEARREAREGSGRIGAFCGRIRGSRPYLEGAPADRDPRSIRRTSRSRRSAPGTNRPMVVRADLGSRPPPYLPLPAISPYHRGSSASVHGGDLAIDGARSKTAGGSAGQRTFALLLRAAPALGGVRDRHLDGPVPHPEGGSRDARNSG